MILVSVLVLEFGYLDPQKSDILVPWLAQINPYLSNYTTVRQRGLNDRVCQFPSGAVVGGSSAVNGMVWQRASAADHDAWAELGNSGWTGEDLFPYSKKVNYKLPELTNIY
jgi:choline dehydrogenase-like flavoprotein